MKRLIVTCVFCIFSVAIANSNALAETMGEPPAVSSKYCVDASKLEPALQSKFVEAVAKLFEATPCRLGEPRIVVTSVNETDLCKQAKALLTTDTKAAVPVLLNNCSKEEADRAVQEAMRLLKDYWRIEEAFFLAARFNLVDSELIRLYRANIGYLRIATNPYAQFSIDGDSRGDSPARRVEVQAGDHTVTFTNEDRRCKPLTLHVRVERGKESFIKAELECPNME